MHKLNVHYLMLAFLCYATQYATPYESREVLSDLKKLKELIEKKSYVKKGISCRPLTFDEKMLQYKSETGYNTGIVAATKKEAVLFPNLLWDVDKRKTYMFLLKNLTWNFERIQNISDPNKILIIKNLFADFLNLTKVNITGITSNIHTRQSGQASKVMACKEPGQRDSKTKDIYLCRQCSVITTMAYDR